jgi:hypothetical protein
MPALRTSIWIPEYPLRVEMTHCRTAAYGHRTFNVGFLAMNPKGRLSQPDPLRKFAPSLRPPAQDPEQPAVVERAVIRG